MIMTNNAKLTVRLPASEIEFARQYARNNGLTLTALVHRYFSRLHGPDSGHTPPEVSDIAGLVPPDTDARKEYAEHSESKHR